MVTLKTLQKYLNLREVIEDFFDKKCSESLRAHMKVYVPDWDYTLESPNGKFDSFEMIGKKICIVYGYPDGDTKTYFLPLDIIFDDDFFDKMVGRFTKEKRVEQEKEKERELRVLEELKRKYEE
jgi:hypothetical protein